MTVIHPLQGIVSNASGSLTFIVSKSTILAYKYDNKEFSLVGKWVDEAQVNENHNLAKSSELANVATKKQKGNEGESLKRPTSDPLFPMITSQIRNLQLSQDETKLIACADSDKSVLIFDVLTLSEEQDNCLKLIKRQPFPKRPNAIALTDSDELIIADKFGDAYVMDAYKEEVQEIGQPVLGHVSMLTDVLFRKDEKGLRYLITCDRDEHIKISHYPQSYIVDKWLFGHKQFVSSLSSPSWKPEWLFSVGGDEVVYAWNWVQGSKLSEFDYTKLIQPYLTKDHLAAARFQNESDDNIEYAVAKVVSCQTLPFIAFFVEATKVLVILNVCQEKGILSLKQVIEVPFKIISLSENNNGFQITCDNRETEGADFLKFISYNKVSETFEIDNERSSLFDSTINESLKSEPSVNVESNDIYPMYNIITLKKHGEHYS